MELMTPVASQQFRDLTLQMTTNLEYNFTETNYRNIDSSKCSGPTTHTQSLKKKSRVAQDNQNCETLLM